MDDARKILDDQWWLALQRMEEDGVMLEERFGLGEWEEGRVGGGDAENCTFW